MNITNQARFKTGSRPDLLASAGTIPGSVSQIGFWSAVLATLCSIGYGITAMSVLTSSLATATETSSG